MLLSGPNSADISQMDLIAEFYSQYMGMDVFYYDYSGFGLSGGTAGEHNAYESAYSVYCELRNRWGL